MSDLVFAPAQANDTHLHNAATWQSRREGKFGTEAHGLLQSSPGFVNLGARLQPTNPLHCLTVPIHQRVFAKIPLQRECPS